MSSAHLSPADEATLLTVGLDAVAQVLGTGRFDPPAPDAFVGPLAEPGASFVTLTRDGALLGCIGTLTAHRALVVDVAHHAVAAGFADPRLPPITVDDYRAMEMKVSVLTPPEPMSVGDLPDLVRSVEPGRDGLLVESRSGHATFLPSVWEQLPDPVRFLDALWHKAGWRPGFWPADLRASRYRTHEITDTAPRPVPGPLSSPATGVTPDR
jgi:AmmeMemoRadiSam system protein A